MFFLQLLFQISLSDLCLRKCIMRYSDNYTNYANMCILAACFLGHLLEQIHVQYIIICVVCHWLNCFCCLIQYISLLSVNFV